MATLENVKCSSTAGMLGNVAAVLRVYAGVDEQLHSFLTSALRRRLGDPKPRPPISQPVAQLLDTKAVYKTAALTCGFGTTS